MKPPRVTLSILDASEPLRKRAPTVDEDGKAVTDFMVIFPGLRKQPLIQIQRTTQEIHRILGCFSDDVVFAELNLALNLLWVSTKPILGKRFEIAEAIRSSIPSARLVSHL
jgi:isocitrate lyase